MTISILIELLPDVLTVPSFNVSYYFFVEKYHFQYLAFSILLNFFVWKKSILLILQEALIE